jgi:mono/diheme cytochrome c family protein
MKTNLIVLTVVGLGAVSAFHTVIRAQPPQSMSVSDGVYTEEQAKRGEALYGERCGSCHGLTLTGKDGPPLAGDTFIANWSGLSVGDLFERTRISMPQDSPGSLSRAENADVVAFVLKFNKYPAGERPLATEAEALRQIQIVAPR